MSQASNSPPFTAEQVQQLLKQKQFQYLRQIVPPPGEIFLRAGIHDAVSRTVGTLEIPLHGTKRAARPGGESGGKGRNWTLPPGAMRVPGQHLQATSANTRNKVVV